MKHYFFTILFFCENFDFEEDRSRRLKAFEIRKNEFNFLNNHCLCRPLSADVANGQTDMRESA